MGIAVPFCFPFLLTFFLYSNLLNKLLKHGSSPWAWSPSGYTCSTLCSSPWATRPAWSQLMCELSMGCSFLQAYQPAAGSSLGCGEDICSVAGCRGTASFLLYSFLHWLQGRICSDTLGISSSSFFSDLCVPNTLSLIYFSTFQITSWSGIIS